MNLSRKMITLIVAIVLIVLGVANIIDAIHVAPKIMTILVIGAGVMLLREAK